MTMWIIIPTYRRTDKQTTFSFIPKSWHKRTIFIADAEDTPKLKKRFGDTGAQFLTPPTTITSIAQKRVWILKQRQWNKLVMFDDDLRFSKRKDGKLLTIPAAEVAPALEALEAKLEDYVHAGISARQGNNHLGAGWNYNMRMMYALGYHAPTVRNVCTLGRVECREDMELTLQLLKQGYENAVLADYAVDQAYNTAGGAKADGRTVEQSNAEADKLAALHPGLVRVVEKAYAASLNRREVVVSWKKSLNWDSKWQ